MANITLMKSEESIKEKILTIRGVQVMLDSDLAVLYEVSTKRLNQQVTRNLNRFPENFRFQLTESEYNSLQNFVTRFNPKNEKVLRLQFATFKNQKNFKGKHRKYLPYVFTEQGVAMLSAVLKSEAAVNVSIGIINAFVNMRRFISSNAQIFQRLDSVEKKHFEYDAKFEKVFAAIEDKSFQKNKEYSSIIKYLTPTNLFLI